MQTAFMLCYQLLVNWTEKLSTEYLAFVLRITINNFLSLQIRPMLIWFLLYQLGNIPCFPFWKCSDCQNGYVTYSFLEGAQRCRSNTEILSKQQGWAEGSSGTRGRAIASNCQCHKGVCPEQCGLGQVGHRQIRPLLRLVHVDLHMTAGSNWCLSSEDQMIWETKVIQASCLLYLQGSLGRKHLEFLVLEWQLFAEGVGG